MTNKQDIVFVILSDLHFGCHALDESENPLAFPSSLNNDADRLSNAAPDSYSRQFVEGRCVAHDLNTVSMLPAYIKSLRTYEQSTGFRDHERYKFDFFLFLGDLVTYPNPAAFSFVGDFIQSHEPLRAAIDNELRARSSGDMTDDSSSTVMIFEGLKLLKNQFLMIPGNHDKLLQCDLSRYFQYLSKPTQEIDEPQPRSAYLVSRTFNEQEFLFILMDASVYLKEGQHPLSNMSHFAEGLIDEELQIELRKKLSMLQQGGRVDDAELTRWNKAFKILLVHYAVDEKSFGSRFRLKSSFPPLGCRGLQELVASMRVDIDLVLHGHLHRTRLYTCDGVPVVSATTCTQKSGNKGFYIMRFSDNKKFQLEHHSWRNTGFRPDPNPDLSGRWENGKWSKLPKWRDFLRMADRFGKS